MASSNTPQIEIPKTDIWTTLFDREYKPFPDHQVLYKTPSGSSSISYSSLRDTTISFGTGLRDYLSFKKSDVLAIFAQNCIYTPAVTWGTHFCGGIVSPANPAYTARELSYHLKDSGARILVTQTSLLPVASRAAHENGIPDSHILLMDDERPGGKHVSAVRHFKALLKDGGTKGDIEEIDAEKDLAYLVYSSGTTGLPKGVMLSHYNSVSDMHMLAHSERELINAHKDRILSVLPYYHIYGLQCLVHLPCFLGVTTVVMPSFSIEEFCDIIQKHKITYTYVAPPVIVHLAKSPVVAKYCLRSLKTITSGAAPLTKELILAVKKRLGIEVKQAYGLSETSPVTHIQKFWDEALGSVGPPLPNQVILFMNAKGNEVPHGKEGEIWIKGPNVFQGYLNNIEATKSSLTADGFFKTGDIGYRDAKGNMFVTDRVKELIKYKGFQVAPAELEGLLMDNVMIEDVAVVGIYDKERETEVPIACVVTKSDVKRNQESKDTIIEWIADRVAGHKRLRGGVEWVDQIPKTASGKILRRELREWVKTKGKLPAKL